MTGKPFDLNAAAAAERGEPWSFTYGGRDFVMVGDLPLDVLQAYAAFADAQLAGGDEESAGLRTASAMGPILESLGALFESDEAYRAFRAMRPGQAELSALLSEVTRRATGASLGEASVPSESSGGDSERPRSISAVSTA